MRRSSLYLTLSIVSLLVAVGMGVAQKRCGYFKQHFTFNCKQRSDCRVSPQRVSPEQDVISVPDTPNAIWDAFYARDFDTMAAEAIVLTDSENPVEGLRLRAYALRGQSRYAESEKTYTETLDAASRAYSEDLADSELPRHLKRMRLVYQCEACYGRAICRHELNQPVGATDDINSALSLARSLARAWGGQDDYYALACVYAVQAKMLSGKDAQEARLKAIGWFQKSLELGFDNWLHARADLDLDSLRGEPAFQALFPTR